MFSGFLWQVFAPAEGDKTVIGDRVRANGGLVNPSEALGGGNTG